MCPHDAAAAGRCLALDRDEPLDRLAEARKRRRRRQRSIGQTKPVFAYRLICEDTVEQRIAELQDRKRKLAEAIVGGEENLIRNLTQSPGEAAELIPPCSAANVIELC
jgi:hypothetical protein